MSFQSGNNLSFTHKRLKGGDYTIRPFQTNKLWNISSYNPEREYFGNYNVQIYRAFYPENHKYFGNVANISSSLYERVFTTQSLDPKVLWYYLDHNYYTEHSNKKQPSFITTDEQITYLAESSSLFIIPVGVFGEGIKQKTVSFTNYNTDSNYQFTVVDDGNGNLRDTVFDETKFVNKDNCLLYLGFNEKYREYNMRNGKLDYVFDFSHHKNEVVLYNTKHTNYIPGIPLTASATPTGVACHISGAYFRINPNVNINFNKNQDFAFSFWINPESNQLPGVNNRNYIFNKNSVKKIYTIDPITLEHSFSETQKEINQYPFDISYNNVLNKISFRQSSDIQTIEVLSDSLTTGSWSHIVCQKTGSVYQVWLNGNLNSEVTSSILNDVGNENIFFIGGSPNSSSCFHGSLDEIRIYDTAISSDKIPYLANNSLNAGYAYQTSRVGNVFYGTGFVVISDPRPKYSNAFLGSTGNFDYAGITNGFRGQFRSTATFYEYEIICKIRRNEFNFTQNPSILVDKASYVSGLENYVTSSNFNPYVTSIGLYDDFDNLVAIAKLTNPLEKRDDVDMNIIVRFDM
jgi:hypothetical protein